MSYLTPLAKKYQTTSRFYIGFYILAFFLQTSQALGIAAVKAQSPEPRPSRGLIINWDCTEFFVSRPSKEMTVAGVQSLVDQYIGTQVSHIFFNPNGMRTAYASRVRESFWDKNEKVNHALIKNTRLLHQKGIDPYKVWIARCREKDISPWISMRMNDIHNTNDVNNFLHSGFWRKHPDYWRVPGSSRLYSDRALDYSIKAVHDHQMALISELLKRYDPDGIELDWMRSPYHFKPGHEKQGAQIILDFTRQVRKLLDQWSIRRGHRIKLAARVPAVPEHARGLGLDGIAWARADLVDILTLAPFWGAADFDIPVERWRELLGQQADKVLLVAGMEAHIRARPRPSEAISNNRETMRGFTAAMLDRGADQIYLFNHFAKPGSQDSIFHEAGRLETVINKPRRHIVTFHDTVPLGVAKRSLLPCLIKSPVPFSTAPIGQFRIYTGPALAQGEVAIRIGLAGKPGFKEAELTARMNSVACKPMGDNNDLGQFPESKRVLQFAVPVSALQRGYNLMEVFLNKGSEQNIVWAEVYIVPDA